MKNKIKIYLLYRQLYLCLNLQLSNIIKNILNIKMHLNYKQKKTLFILKLSKKKICYL